MLLDIDRPYAASISQLEQLQELGFDGVPATLRRRAYDVEYVQLQDASGGRLWVTRHGWPHLPQLDPAHWYVEQQYSRIGTRLTDGSGAVYRVPDNRSGARSHDLVVKFSRLAQDVQLDVSSTFPGGVSRCDLDCASFNDPFQEFGLVEELRCSTFGPPGHRVLTKRPLAIYSPGRSFASWQLARNESCFLRDRNRLARDQSRQDARVKPVELTVDRQYVTLFQWVHGCDLQRLVGAGEITARESARLVKRAVRELAAKGFRMLDIKPNHLIVRMRADGRLVQRSGRVAYALVDFELLQRTKEYEEWRGRQAGSQSPKPTESTQLPIPDVPVSCPWDSCEP